jgi:transcriptional regulator with PAS, ATPase and Fis domain
MILAPEGDIDAGYLPEEIRDRDQQEPTTGTTTEPTSTVDRKLVTLRELEDDYIQEVLVSTGNNKTQAARVLGIHPTSLLRRLKKEQTVS